MKNLKKVKVYTKEGKCFEDEAVSLTNNFADLHSVIKHTFISDSTNKYECNSYDYPISYSIPLDNIKYIKYIYEDN